MLFPRRELRHCADPLDSRLYMGGDSESKQSNDTNLTTTTNTVDRRVVADGGSVVVGDGGKADVNLQVTDFNAVERGAKLAELAIVETAKLATQARSDAGSLAGKALTTAENALGKLEGAYSKANEQAQAVASGNKSLAIVGMIVAAALGYQLLRTRRAKA